MAKYKQLIVFQKADKLAVEVYKLTRNFPPEEIFGITSQLRRAALSIPTNIVEGYGRKNKKELKQFINIALGSLAETEYLLDFSKRMNIGTQKIISKNWEMRINYPDELKGIEIKK